MQGRIKFVTFLIIFIILIDVYAFQAVRASVLNLSTSARKAIYIIYWTFTIIAICSVILNFIFPDLLPKILKTYLVATIFAIYISKILLVLFLLIDDIIRLFKWLNQRFTKEVGSKGTPISRSTFLARAGIIAAAIPFLSLIYGMAINAYNYKIRKVRIKLPNLPQSFSGLRIIQLSDIHAGSFTRKEPLIEAVETINNLQPDLIFFTGDLVNNKASEMEEYIHIFKKLKAKHGVFSIFGNHDYGDYVQWDNKEEKIANLKRLADIHKEMGWKLLTNENHILKNGTDEIAIIGVENWSARMRFPKYGNLSKAYKEIENIPVKLLLSHDPSHWKAEVTKKYKDINIMFAGHTHGMQFGVEIPGFKWSPVQYVYKEWAGLYKKKEQYLYVNRGFGFIGYPGRVGILPEITVLTLEN